MRAAASISYVLVHWQGHGGWLHSSSPPCASCGHAHRARTGRGMEVNERTPPSRGRLRVQSGTPTVLRGSRAGPCWRGALSYYRLLIARNWTPAAAHAARQCPDSLCCGVDRVIDGSNSANGHRVARCAVVAWRVPSEYKRANREVRGRRQTWVAVTLKHPESVAYVFYMCSNSYFRPRTHTATGTGHAGGKQRAKPRKNAGVSDRDRVPRGAGRLAL